MLVEFCASSRTTRAPSLLSSSCRGTPSSASGISSAAPRLQASLLLCRRDEDEETLTLDFCPLFFSSLLKTSGLNPRGSARREVVNGVKTGCPGRGSNHPPGPVPLGRSPARFFFLFI